MQQHLHLCKCSEYYLPTFIFVNSDQAFNLISGHRASGNVSGRFANVVLELNRKSRKSISSQKRFMQSPNYDTPKTATIEP